MNRNENLVFEALKKYISENGIAPSCRELAPLVGLSHSGVHLQLNKLRAMGMIDWRVRIPRSLKVTRWES